MIKTNQDIFTPHRLYATSVYKISLLLCIFIASVWTCHAYDIYVDASADPNGANGTSEHPYLLIQAAIDHAFDDNHPDNQNNDPSAQIIVSDNPDGYIEELVLNYQTLEGINHNVTNICIKSASGLYNQCKVIAPDGSFFTIQIFGSPVGTLKLKGLTITRSSIQGGTKGVSVNNDSPPGDEDPSLQRLEIENCFFDKQNRAIGWSSGIQELFVTSSIFLSEYEDIYLGMPQGIVLRGTANLTSIANIVNNQFYSEPNNCGGDRLSETILLERFSSVNISHNRFVNGAVRLEKSIPNAVIDNNVFLAESILNGDGTAISLINTVTTINASCIINRNVFWNYDNLIMLCKSIPSSNYINYSATIIHNSMLNCNRIATVYRHPNQPTPTNRIALYRDNLYVGPSSTPFQILDINDQQITLSGDDRIPVSFSHFSTELTEMESLILDTTSVSDGDPYISIDEDNHTYELIWTATEKSRCINRGCPVVNGIPQTDPDGTPPDIGAVYYPHFHKKYRFVGNNIFWMSFPVVDDRSFTDGQHWNELGYLFDNHMDVPPDNQIISANWSYSPSSGYMYQVGNDWQSSFYIATQPKGFKLEFRENLTEIYPVTVNGFKVNAATTPIELEREITIEGNTYDFDNWIGYFVPYTQGAGTAFSRFLPGSTTETYLDHIYSIGTQTWKTERIEKQYGSRWIIDPNRYTLSEGDMVAIKLLPNAPEDMSWMCMSQAEPPRVKEAATNFTYIEELDYTPIFMEFDPEDMPEEVGLYVAGVCKGAAVVDSVLIEVNYYATEAKNDSEIEIMFYYGDKGMKKAPAASVYNPETMLFEVGSLQASNLAEYGYISFNRNEGSSLIPLVTELKQNYPNPFKNQTNIAWILAKDAPVSVDIYNLKGQKVKTLFSGLGKKGRQTLSWNGRDENNREVASGVYFYRLNTPESVKVHKMMVLR